jgi:hypothetical protein
MNFWAPVIARHDRRSTQAFPHRCHPAGGMVEQLCAATELMRSHIACHPAGDVDVDDYVAGTPANNSGPK